MFLFVFFLILILADTQYCTSKKFKNKNIAKKNNIALEMKQIKVEDFIVIPRVHCQSYMYIIVKSRQRVRHLKVDLNSRCQSDKTNQMDISQFHFGRVCVCVCVERVLNVFLWVRLNAPQFTLGGCTGSLLNSRGV